MTVIVSALCMKKHSETATRAYKRNNAYMPSGGLRKKASDSIATKLCDTMTRAQDAHGGRCLKAIIVAVRHPTLCKQRWTATR
jgi:hypothetical protein